MPRKKLEHRPQFVLAISTMYNDEYFSKISHYILTSTNKNKKIIEKREETLPKDIQLFFYVCCKTPARFSKYEKQPPLYILLFIILIKKLNYF